MRKIITYLLSIFGILLLINSTSAQNIYTFAGTGVQGSSGDGGAAISAELGALTGVSCDALGNVYICDWYYGRIRKVDINGIITTIAGGGMSYSDGIPATSAIIPKPKGITIDGSGNIYFVESYYNQVKKIDTYGIITTIAGISSSTGGFSGDGGIATSALLKNVYDVAVDYLGNVFISDCSNNRIRMINTAGIINTIAGSNSVTLGDGGPATSAMIISPLGIDVDSNGNLYIGEAQSRIRKVDALGIITTIAGTGVQGNSGDNSLATSAEIGMPYGVKIDHSGNIYISDFYYSTIRKINVVGIITTLAGVGGQGYSGDGGPAITAQIDPFNIGIDTYDNVYIADGSNNRVRKVVINISGLNEQSKKLNLITYPNPTTNTLHISYENNTLDNSIIEITNYLGQTVLKQSYSKTIDVSKLANGICTLKINTEGKQAFYSKFIKE